MIEIRPTGSETSDYLGADDTLSIIGENRSRIRTVCTLVVTCSGLLLSTSFLVVFFAIKERSQALLPGVTVLLLFGCIATLAVALVMSVLAVCLPVPSVAGTKTQLIDGLVRITRREYRRSTYAAAFLLLSVAQFAIAMGTFAASTGIIP